MKTRCPVALFPKGILVAHWNFSGNMRQLTESRHR